jgi:Protein of unknown function (DUF998)
MDVITSSQAPTIDTRIDELVTPNQRLAAISLIVMSVFLALIGLLHVIKPEFEPSWRFLSEYSIGRHGWVMMMAFFLWAISCFTLSVALSEHVKTRRGRTGRIVLVVVGLTLILAGLFAQDPITATPDQLTTHGTLHAIASMIGIPGVPIAALLITWGVRQNAASVAISRGMTVTAHLTWVSLLAMAIYLAIAVPRAGGFGPDVPAGWLNRAVVLAYWAWQMVASYGIYRVDPHADRR